MQFLAQILLDGLGRPAGEADTQADRVMAIFMCQNDPGLCDEWSPTAGGNRALLYPSDALRPMAAPVPDGDEDVLRLGAVNAVTLVSSPAADYSEAREEWGNRSGNSPRNVLGQLGGQPDWLQGDETPACATCTQPMILVAQLEEGPDHTTAMNFGGGTAFAFACGPCAQGAFLWQC
ncbi:hypothetical protein [Streptomyces sp.]|uniref:hypothetical protein n=1 Tax=Streptomyces sp. TaxID=1931 RepID=UPI002D71E908|nr:hypothetical protein [Streptomyces sp.]HZF88447.1 hypothetical protein [Streptomyces sp.]